MRRSNGKMNPSCRGASFLVLLAVCLGMAGEARAATPPWSAVARAVAPLATLLDEGENGGQQQEEQEPLRPPPPPDPEAGPVVSILGGTVWSGSSTFQMGGAFAYFFGNKGTAGFEVESDLTLGPGGRVIQVMGSFVIQFGARTSKFVPYAAGGVGYLRATSDFPEATRDVLESLGIVPQPQEEQAPFYQFGGGLRFYVKPTVSFRADLRFAQVALDLPGVSFSDSLFPMRRIVGAISWDF